MKINFFIRTAGANKLYRIILFSVLEKPYDQDLQELKRTIEINLKRNGISHDRLDAIHKTVKSLHASQQLRKKLNTEIL